MLGDWFVSLMIGGFLFIYFFKKVIAAVDGDGEIKKTASEGFADCFKKMFK
jgi:hypothetical protein